MKREIFLLVCGLMAIAIALPTADQTIEQQEAEARELLKQLGPELHSRRNVVTEASWAYASNITDHNLQKQNEASAENAKYAKVSMMKICTLTGLTDFDIWDYCFVYRWRIWSASC